MSVYGGMSKRMSMSRLWMQQWIWLSPCYLRRCFIERRRHWCQWNWSKTGLDCWGRCLHQQFLLAHVQRQFLHIWLGFLTFVLNINVSCATNLGESADTSSADYKYQITTVSECGVERIGSLPFDLQGGTCMRTTDYLVLCFGKSDKQQCHRATSPLGQFTQLDNKAQATLS